MSSECPRSVTCAMNGAASVSTPQLPLHHENLLYLFRDLSPPLDFLNTKVVKYLLCKISYPTSNSGSRALPVGSGGFSDSEYLGSKAGFSDDFKALAQMLKKCFRFLNLSPDMRGKKSFFQIDNIFSVLKVLLRNHNHLTQMYCNWQENNMLYF